MQTLVGALSCTGLIVLVSERTAIVFHCVQFRCEFVVLNF